MKRIKTFFAATLVVMLAFFASCNEASAQTILSDTLTSGQLVMYPSLMFELGPNDTVTVTGMFDDNASMSTPFMLQDEVYEGNGVSTELVAISDTVVSGEGWKWFQYVLQNQDVLIESEMLSTYVRTMPSTGINSITWNTTSFDVSYSATAGDTLATLLIEVDPFSSDFSVQHFSVLDTSFTGMLFDSHIVDGLPEGSDVSFRITVINSLGEIITDTVAVSLDTTPQAPSIGNILLVSVDQTSANISVDVVNYGLPCALDYYLVDEDLPNNLLMFPIGAIAPSDDVVIHTMSFTNLIPDHAYNVYAHAHNLLGESDTIVVEFHTLALPELLSISDTGNSEPTSPTSTEVHSELYVPSGTTVDVYLYVSNINDPDVTEPFFATDVANFESGIWYPSYTVESLEEGEQYYGKWIAIGSDGSYAEDIFSFTQEEYVIPTTIEGISSIQTKYYANGFLYGFAQQSVVVHNMQGQIVYSEMRQSNHIDLSFLPAGVYIIPRGEESALRFIVQ